MMQIIRVATTPSKTESRLIIDINKPVHYGPASVYSGTKYSFVWFLLLAFIDFDPEYIQKPGNL